MAKEKYQTEAQQEYCVFEDLPAEALVPTSSFFDSIARRFSPYSREQKGNQFLHKITALFYQWLNEITGKENYVILRERDSDPYKEILSLLRREGILTGISRGFKYNDMPFFPRLKLNAIPSKDVTDGMIGEEVPGFSVGVNAEEVSAKAIGELLERYFFSVYRRRDLTRTSSDALKKRGIAVLNLHNLAGFSGEQKNENPRLQWTESSAFWWDKGKILSTGKHIYLPAQLLFRNYVSDEEGGEPILREANSNGCGGMFTEEGAILSGLYELIHRDAFLIHWLNSRAPSKIDPETIPDTDFQRIFTMHKRYGYKVHCLNITVDLGIPSFAVIMIDPSGKGPYLSVGAAASPNPALALRHAIEEAHAVLYWARSLPPAEFPRHYRPFRDASVDQRARVGLWANPNMAKHIVFFLEGETKKFSQYQFGYPEQFTSPLKELEFLVNHIEKMGNGYEVYTFTPRHPLLLRLGYIVSRVIVPQLFPLYLNETNALLGVHRLSEVPRKLGWKGCFINTIPHPFS